MSHASCHQHTLTCTRLNIQERLRHTIKYKLIETSRESQNAAQRTSYRWSRCQNVLTKRNCRLYSSFVTILVFEFCHKLSSWVLSQFEFLSFVTIWFFWVSSQFEFLSFITIWVFEFYHNLSFWVSSQLVFLSFITIWVFEFHHNLTF